MPSIFNDKEQKSIHALLDKGFDYGEDSIAKGISKGIKGTRKIIYFIIAGLVVIFGFILGCFNVKSHFGDKT